MTVRCLNCVRLQRKLDKHSCDVAPAVKKLMRDLGRIAAWNKSATVTSDKKAYVFITAAIDRFKMEAK